MACSGTSYWTASRRISRSSSRRSVSQPSSRCGTCDYCAVLGRAVRCSVSRSRARGAGHLEQDAARPRSDRREARELFLDVRRRERPVLCADDQRREAEQLARGVLLVQEEVRRRLHDEGRPREPGQEVARAAADSSRVHAEGSQLRAHAGGEEEGRLLAELARDLGLERLEPRAAAVHVDGVALAAHLCGGRDLRRVCEHLRGWPARKGGAEAERLRRERRCDGEGDRSHKLPGVQNTELRAHGGGLERSLQSYFERRSDRWQLRALRAA